MTTAVQRPLLIDQLRLAYKAQRRRRDPEAMAYYALLMQKDISAAVSWKRFKGTAMHEVMKNSIEFLAEIEDQRKNLIRGLP